MLIRIRNTTFGLVVNGIVKPKSPKDPPFDVDEKLGLRLVREGIAEAVDGAERGEVQSESIMTKAPAMTSAYRSTVRTLQKPICSRLQTNTALRYLQLRPSRSSSRRLTTFSPTRFPMIRRANNGL